MSTEKIVLARVLAAHGVKGLFKIKIYSESEKSFFSYKDHFLIKNKEIDIEKKFNKGKYLICGSSLYKNREQVKNIIDEKIFILKKNLESLNTQEYFHEDLIGCNVVNQRSKMIGNVKAIHNFGAGDLLELDSDYPYMLRFGDVKKENINLKMKLIIIDNEVVEN